MLSPLSPRYRSSQTSFRLQPFDPSPHPAPMTPSRLWVASKLISLCILEPPCVYSMVHCSAISPYVTCRDVRRKEPNHPIQWTCLLWPTVRSAPPRDTRRP